MLPFLMPEANSSLLMIEAIRKRGLTSSLQLCLDARDKDSYTSGQAWLDRSGNGYDFIRGSGSGSDAADPTFNGTAGMPTGYWGFDGSDDFTYDAANEAWMENLHKNNAAFTLLLWYYPAANSAVYGFCGTNAGTASEVGIQFAISSGILVFAASTGAGNACLATGTAVTTPAVGAWNLLALSVNEPAGAGGSFFCRNGVVETFDGSYASPSSAGAARTMQLGARGNHVSPLGSGDRLAAFAAWSTPLTADQINGLFHETRGAFAV